MLWSQLVRIFFCSLDSKSLQIKYLARINNIVAVLIQTNGEHRLKFCENLLSQPQKTLNSYQEHKLHEIPLYQSL